MRGIFLSIVVVCALVAAGIGGTLADFSDSEEEIGDILQAGSLDLKVDGKDDPNLLPHSLGPMVPEKSYHITKTLRNDGTIDGWLYIHLKNVVCTETNDKDLDGDGVITAPADNPEPENVAQDGGKVGQETVPGVGDNVTLDKHIEIHVYFGPTGNLTEVDLSDYDANNDGKVKMDEFTCSQVLISRLVKCGAEFDIQFEFILQDVSEDDLGIHIFDVNDPNEIKWNWWPTNAMQGDTVTFDILYELLQTDYTPPGG